MRNLLTLREVIQMVEHIPQVGDYVVARRRELSERKHNLVIGPVTKVRGDSCRINTNDGTDIAAEWDLFYDEWKFEKLDL